MSQPNSVIAPPVLAKSPGGAGSSLAAVLALYNALPDHEKVSALRFISKSGGDQDHLPLTPNSPHTTFLDDAHSCAHCQKLVISRNEYLQEGRLRLTKQDLIQGIGPPCLLFRWIFRLLGRGLAKFQGELSENMVVLSKNQHSSSLGSAIDDLDYISTQTGITVKLDIGTAGATLSISYDLEPVLVDRLWDTLPPERKISKSYDEFRWSCAQETTATSFQIYATQDDPAAVEVPNRVPVTNIGSDSSYAFARTCLQTCHDKHLVCPKSTGILPSRLIDVGARFPIRSVKLYWTEEGESGKYAALSYCWGGQQPLQSTRHTAQDFTDGIPYAKLPKTIQDAVLTTFKLGLRYIWIDCLCIIQDDNEDVAREIANMAQIFRQAAVTISASSARNIHDGFLDLRHPQTVSRLKLPYRTLDGTSGSVMVESARQYSPERDPISLRAWTLQERMLSPRILDYSSEQLWWVCREAVLYDSGHETPTGALLDDQSRKQNLETLEGWRSVVRDYTKRFLTFPSDKLPAISGVAAEYGQVFDGVYLAGLWKFALPSELLWSTTRSDISRPARQRAPSWTWAAVDGEVNHNWCPNYYENAITILECRVSPVSSLSPYGSVDPLLCTLKVQGYMKVFRWTRDKQHLFECLGHVHSVGRALGDAEEFLSLGFHPGPRNREFYHVWGLIVTSKPTRGLLLAEVGKDTFKRVGMFFRLWEKGLDGFTERSITIH